MPTQFQPELSMHLLNFMPQDPGNGWSHMLDFARAADVAGVDRITVSDHVVFGEALDEYGKPEVGGRTGGKQPTGPDGHWLEPMTTLSVVAGATSNVRVGTQILLAALRRPVILAKTTATLDVLSGGRLDLGVGVGWQKAEYDAAGLSFEKRGRLLDHTLEVCQTLWTEMRASYTAPELTFDGIHQCPKPTRPEGVPVWISGTIRDTTVRRLVRFGLRWIPWGADDLNMIDSLPRMKDAIAKAGGDPAALQASGGVPYVKGADGAMDIARTMARVPEFVAAGQTSFTCPFMPSGDRAATEARLREIVQAFRSATGRAQVG